MLLSNTVLIRVYSNNINNLINKGYNIPKRYDKSRNRWTIPRNTFINVNVNDLTKGSHAEVKVKCDYCHKEKNMQYKEYLRRHDDILGDCCHQCEFVKCRQTLINKYGDNWKDILTERSMANRDPAKMGFAFVSKPQRELYNILSQKYNCELEKRCGRYSMDIVIEYNNKQIDIEYDGCYFHGPETEEREIKRDTLINQYYPILHIKGNTKNTLPSLEVVEEKLNCLTNNLGIEYIVM